MKKLLVIILIVFCSFTLFAAQDDVFTRGDSQISFGLAAKSGSDYSMISLLAGYGYFLTNRFVAGTEMGVHVTSDSAVIYEPMVSGRFYLLNKRPLMPFVGINTGYIYSPDYTYRTSYSIFCDTDVDGSFSKEQFDADLSIVRVSPETGVSYMISNSAIATLAVSINNYFPINDTPAEGYTLKNTKYLSLSLGFSMML